MKRLFVGCRVRVVRIAAPIDWLQLIGQEGRIVGEFVPGSNFQWHVDLPNHQFSVKGGFSFNTEHLEPILPEGHKPADMSFEQLMESFSEVTA